MQISDQQFRQATVRPKQKIGCSFILLPLSAIIMLGIGLWFGYLSYGYYSNGVETESEVVRLVQSSDEDGITYSPVYRYRIDGVDYEYESINSSNPPSHQVGESAVLLVDPDDLTRARVNSFWELWLLPVIFLPVSALMMGLSFFIPILFRFTNR